MSMDNGFSAYCASRIKWRKFSADYAFWLGTFFLVGLIFGYLTGPHACPVTGFLNKLSEVENFSEYSNNIFCENNASLRYWAAIWLIINALRVPLLRFWGGGIFLKTEGLRMARADGKNLSITQALFYVLVEWLPTHIIMAYYLITPHFFTSFERSRLDDLMLTAQLIWVAPVIFTWKGRNLTQILTGISAHPSDKFQKKIEKEYTGKIRKALGKLSIGISFSLYILFTTVFAFSLLQILRMPPLEPDYQEIVYGNRAPVWDSNISFAVAGLSAPADIENFYEYGLRKTYERAAVYEETKKRSHIDPRYLYPVPQRPDFTVQLNPAKEIKIDDKDWKDLTCLYAFEPENPQNCATLTDFKEYIKEYKIAWDRFNHLPDMGKNYSTPPQFMGSDSKILVPLAKLKAADIIHIAQKGNPEKAFQEWLRYTKLYRLMGADHDAMVFKAIMILNMSAQRTTLERLLSIAPELARKHYKELMAALENDKPIYNETAMLADDWGLFEPIITLTSGPAHAIQNEMLVCVKNFSDLGKTSFDKYPYGPRRHALCPLSITVDDIDKTLLHARLSPGGFVTNVMYDMVVGGILKGETLIQNIKRDQVKLRQAQLAVSALNQNIKAENMQDFANRAPPALQNPITKAPFQWDAKINAFYFMRPDMPDWKYNFRINLHEKPHENP